MTKPEDHPANDPRHHTMKLKTMLEEVRQHAREDIGKIEDPKGQALFETTAEVLGGLLNAYNELRATRSGLALALGFDADSAAGPREKVHPDHHRPGQQAEP